MQDNRKLRNKSRREDKATAPAEAGRKHISNTKTETDASDRIPQRNSPVLARLMIAGASVSKVSRRRSVLKVPSAPAKCED